MNYKDRKMKQCEQVPVLRELLILQVKHVSYDWILQKKLSQKHSGNDMADHTFFLVSD